MMNKKEFKKIAREIFRMDKGIPNPKLMHPARDWQIGLGLGAIILVSVSWWNLDTYLTYREDTVIEQTENTGENIVYREALVSAALESFEEIDKTHQSLRNFNQSPEESATETPSESEIETNADENISTSTDEVEIESDESQNEEELSAEVETVPEVTPEFNEDEVIEVIGTPIPE
jgi:hypothetical protein